MRNIRRGGEPPWAAAALAPEFGKALLADGTIDPAMLRGAPRDISRTRTELLRVLRWQSDAANAPGTATAASYGLEVAMPFHDKRIIEFGLAIPEGLYVRDGRSRYLACKALADIYPSEFQTRDPYPNDSLDPDFNTMIDSIRPELMTEVKRMADSETLSRYVDFNEVYGRLASGRAATNPTAKRRLVFAVRDIDCAVCRVVHTRQSLGAKPSAIVEAAVDTFGRTAALGLGAPGVGRFDHARCRPAFALCDRGFVQRLKAIAVRAVQFQHDHSDMPDVET
ncbi:MAG: asparagine synthase-related protein [Pseudolabrys sp.]